MEDKSKSASLAGPENPRQLGRVVSMRPSAPGIIVSPGNSPNKFVFSSALVSGVEMGCLVTFTPHPPREEKHECGQAVDVVVALPASEVPQGPKKGPTRTTSDRSANSQPEPELSATAQREWRPQ
jgi:hypothetical protein